MEGIPESLTRLIKQFTTLPGIGKKTAERLAVYILKSSKSKALEFSESIENVKNNISIDEDSFCFKENDSTINDMKNRDKNILCIVKDSTEVFLIEKSGYRGHYHVLNGLISPLDGVSAEDLNIDSLLNKAQNYNEIIIAVDPTAEGDITTQYLVKVLKNFNINLTRLARGIPVGLSFDYLDEITLTHSIEDRVKIK